MNIVKYEIDEKKYIKDIFRAYTSFPEKYENDNIEPLPKMEYINGLIDEYGNYKYQLIDGKIILNPQKPTPEQIEAKRKAYIVAEIRKKYTVDDEIKLLWRGTEEEKLSHEAYIQDAKKKWEDTNGIRSS
jgi:hypothetical protein